jgi:hypothetical protein
MKNFIKENMVLVVGLTLPLLLIVLFFVAAVIPKAFGMPPQYEMLFTTTRYEYQDPPDYSLDFIVRDQKLIVKAHKNNNKDQRGYNSKLLMAYDGKTETVREINIDLAKAANAAGDNEAVLEETSSWTIDSSLASPDGYTLDGPSYRDGGLVGGIFGGGYSNNSFRLKKGSVGYKIPDTQGAYYYNQVHFVGWVIKK